MGKNFNQEEWTTITLLRKTHAELEKRKVHPKQSFDEVIQQLLEEAA